MGPRLAASLTPRYFENEQCRSSTGSREELEEDQEAFLQFMDDEVPEALDELVGGEEPNLQDARLEIVPVPRAATMSGMLQVLLQACQDEVEAELELSVAVGSFEEGGHLVDAFLFSVEAWDAGPDFLRGGAPDLG